MKIYLGGREGGGYESGQGTQHGEDISRRGRERGMSLIRGLKYISEGEGGGYESGQGSKIYI